MGAPIIRATKYHGMADLGATRYLALYLSQFGWLLLGFYLLRHALWPSTCTPSTFVQIYTCSIRLPEHRNWVEAALLTWLWSTPILILLDLSRRYRSWADKRSR